MTSHRPVAYLAIRDDELRSKITAALRGLGWSVEGARTGVHLLHALSGLILGDAPAPPIGLIAVEDALPGCRGSSIVRGLRDLGIDVPVAIVAPEDAEVRRLEDPERRVHVFEPGRAALGIRAIALARSGVDADGPSRRATHARAERSDRSDQAPA